MSDASNWDFTNNPRRIRSKHRRRLILRLSQGDATVSKLANDSGLRMPHASAEIRRMREEGLVSSDLPAGSRGSRIRLTQKGWQVIQDDEWSKLLELENIPQTLESCCVLSRDEANLTLCFLSPPIEPMVQIPNRQKPSSPDSIASTRNQGVSWNWAVLSERSPRWFDKDNRSILEAPPELAGPERIEAYIGKTPVIGLIRATLLNHENSSTISPGEWFSQPRQIQQAPLDEPTYHRGDWLLGSPHSKSPDIRPSRPIAAIIRERLPRSVLLRSARTNSLVVADLSGLDMSGNEYPIGALEHWIQSAHPRLSDSERRRRLNSLRDRITSPRRIKAPESTLRKFRKDWGGAEFTTDDSSIRLIDLRGLGKNAIESLLRWSLGVKSAPLVLELGDDLPNDLLSRISSHQNLRLVMLESMSPQFSSFDNLEVDGIRTLPWLRFSTSTGNEVPVRLLEQGKMVSISKEVENSTISPRDVLGLPPTPDQFQVELEGDSVSIIFSALSQFPEGDEEWANQMEAMYPLASWIASPKTSRWQRWQRVSSRLDSEWLALLDVDYLPIERISEIADQAPESVKSVFSDKITIKLREDPDNLLRSWPAIDPNQANSGAAWLASLFIQNSAWLPRESYPDLLDWAVEAWLSHPPRESLGAMMGLSWLYETSNQPNEKFEATIRRIRDKGANLPKGHQLNTWSMLYDHSFEIKKADLQSIELFLRDLPYSWWAVFSSEFLMEILENQEARDLIGIRIPWCAAILRPVGERSEAPGLSSSKNPGCDPSIIEPLQNFLRSFDDHSDSSDSLDPLWDLSEALVSVSEGRTPPAGRSHKLSGWLAQPLERWPTFTIDMVMDGDKFVSERLILGKSGFHSGLSEGDFSNQPLGS